MRPFNRNQHSLVALTRTSIFIGKKLKSAHLKATAKSLKMETKGNYPVTKVGKMPTLLTKSNKAVNSVVINYFCAADDEVPFCSKVFKCGIYTKKCASKRPMR